MKGLSRAERNVSGRGYSEVEDELRQVGSRYPYPRFRGGRPLKAQPACGLRGCGDYKSVQRVSERPKGCSFPLFGTEQVLLIVELAISLGFQKTVFLRISVPELPEVHG